MARTKEENRLIKNKKQREYNKTHRKEQREYSKKYKETHKKTQNEMKEYRKKLKTDETTIYKNALRKKEREENYKIQPIVKRTNEEQKQHELQLGKEYREKNKERLNEYQRKWKREWRKENKEHCRKYQNEYRLKNKEKVTKRNRTQYYKDIYKTWARATIYTHKRRKTEITISLEELTTHAKNTKRCMYCHKPLSWGKNGKVKSNSPTIDRMNNNKTIDSIWNGEKVTTNMGAIVCHSCNCGKGEQTMTEWIDRCKKIICKWG